MQGAVNFARGQVRLTLSGPFPERLLNLCAQRGLVFWAVERRDEHTLSFTLLRRDRRRLEELAGRAGCTVLDERQEGLPAFLLRFRRRYAFLLGLALSVCAVCFLSSFILTVEVTGNEQVPRAVILAQVRRLGLTPGAYGPGLDTKQIALDTQLALDELSYVSVNLYGTRAQVVVREAVPPPDILEEEGVSDIVARAGGLILDVEAVQGQARVQPGDVVGEGEVLISGTVAMEGPQYSDVPTRYLYVRAAGSVWARTWRTVQASIPLTANVKDYTGEQTVRWSVALFDKRINFYGNGSISWPCYDKISHTRPLTLPNGQVLPFSLTRETLTAWQPRQVEVDTGAAQDLLQARLLEELEGLVGSEGQVSAVSWSARIAEGLLTVTGTAECREQIGRATPAANIVSPDMQEADG